MITVDLAQAIAELNAIAARAADSEPFLAAVGAQQVAKVRARIMSGKADPEGEPWSPWKDATRARRERKGNDRQGLLWDVGTLLSSIVYESSLRNLAVGSAQPYAGYLQDGTTKMDARPYLGWEEADIASVEALYAAWLETGAL